MKRVIVLLSSVLIFAVAGCSENSASLERSKPDTGLATDTDAAPASRQSADSSDAFDKDAAVAAVLKDRTEFPKPGEPKAISTTVGGEAPGLTVKGTLTTSVDTGEEADTYIVTLTKKWDFTFNDKQLVGNWTYKVTPSDVQLIASEDNTELIQLVK